MSSEGLKRLKVWCEAQELAVEVYKTVIPCLPLEEKWALSSQLRRSAASIPANIAEGYGRFYYQANVQFCYTARGSLEETISHILLAAEIGYLPPEKVDSILHKADALALLLNGYIAYLKKSKQGIGEPKPSHQINEESTNYRAVDQMSSEVAIGFDDSQLSILDSQD